MKLLSPTSLPFIDCRLFPPSFHRDTHQAQLCTKLPAFGSPGSLWVVLGTWHPDPCNEILARAGLGTWHPDPCNEILAQISFSRKILATPQPDLMLRAAQTCGFWGLRVQTPGKIIPFPSAWRSGSAHTRSRSGLQQVSSFAKFQQVSVACKFEVGRFQQVSVACNSQVLGRQVSASSVSKFSKTQVSASLGKFGKFQQVSVACQSRVLRAQV